MSSSSHFITLTYDNLHVPVTSNGFLTLDKTALPSFIKRLRKYEKEKVKYYACGEYGGRTDRPHYHAIVFNVSNPLNYQKAWSIIDDGRRDPIGHVDCGEVTGDSIAYCCKYMDKPHGIPRYDRDDRQKEFSLMSKNLGISWMSRPAILQYFKENLDQLYITRPGGTRLAMPRYYRDRMFTPMEKLRQLDFVEEAMDFKKAVLADYAYSIGKRPEQYEAEIREAEWRKFQKRNSKNRYI